MTLRIGKNAGPIFGYNALEDDQQWSGSATVNSDGSIQLYYTKNDTSGGKLNWQQLASATLTWLLKTTKLLSSQLKMTTFSLVGITIIIKVIQNS